MSRSNIAFVALAACFFALMAAVLFWEAKEEAALREIHLGSVTSLHLDLAATVLAVDGTDLTVLWSTSNGVAVSKISSSDFEALIAK